VANETVHLLRRPVGRVYTERQTVGRGDVIAPLVQPDATLAVETLFVSRR